MSWGLACCHQNGGDSISGLTIAERVGVAKKIREGLLQDRPICGCNTSVGWSTRVLLFSYGMNHCRKGRSK
jgi:hypothetical protein